MTPGLTDAVTFICLLDQTGSQGRGGHVTASSKNETEVSYTGEVTGHEASITISRDNGDFVASVTAWSLKSRLSPHRLDANVTGKLTGSPGRVKG